MINEAEIDNGRAAASRLATHLVAMAAFVAAFLAPRIAEAVPAFARKYATSCSTCHVAFPKLNPFGEAFRINGYQIPEGDEAFIKEEPVSLGSQAWKRVWPDATWPSSIPGSIPLAIRGTGAFMGDLREAPRGTKRISADFRFPTALNLYAAGNLAEDISFWLGAHLYLGGASGELGKIFVQFSSIADAWVPRQLFNIRVGQFVPSYLAFDHHRNLTFSTSLISTTSAVSGVPFGAGHVHGSTGYATGGHAGHGMATMYEGGFSMGSSQVGAELFGLPLSNLEYTLGVTNGSGPGRDPSGSGTWDNNLVKDVYGRLRYKIGGMAFDGTLPEPEIDVENDEDEYDDPKLTDQKAWVDNSLIIGAIALYGRGRMRATIPDMRELFDAAGNPIYAGANTPATIMISNIMRYANRVTRFGGDVQLNLGDFDLTGLVLFGRDSNPRGNGRDVDTRLYMGQLDWVLPWSWLIATGRYEEAWFSRGAEAGLKNERQLLLSLTALARPNVRFQIEGQVDLKREAVGINNDYIVGVLDASF